jgi:hypothetical protein
MKYEQKTYSHRKSNNKELLSESARYNILTKKNEDCFTIENVRVEECLDPSDLKGKMRLLDNDKSSECSSFKAIDRIEIDLSSRFSTPKTAYKTREPDLKDKIRYLNVLSNKLQNKEKSNNYMLYFKKSVNNVNFH